MTTEQTIKDLNAWLTLVGRFITPTGIILLLLLQTQFASVDEVREAQAQIVKLETAVTLLIEQQKQNERQDVALAELSNRLRGLEIKVAEGSQSK